MLTAESTENSIRPGRRKRAKVPQSESRTIPSAAKSPTNEARSRVGKPADNLVPEQVRARFVQQKNMYYFPDGTAAFTDRGNRLTTASENTEVVRSLVAIAQARGWREVSVRGTERFRREAWSAARVAGLEVRGYEPTDFEQTRLVRRLAQESAAKANGSDAGAKAQRSPEAQTDGSQRLKQRGLLTGRLVDHGRAPYRDDPGQAMSYFLRLETGRGERVIWGVDLERALKDSLTRVQVGEEVGLRAVWQEPVMVKTPTQDSDGKVTGEKEVKAQRNHWIVEKRDFFESRAAAARTVRDTNVAPKQAVCVQRRLARSVGVSPTGARVGAP